MAGKLLRILAKTRFDIPTGAAASTVIIARKIDGIMWRDAIAFMRVHSGATWSGGATTKVELLHSPDGFTDEDPNAVWNVPATGIVTLTSVVQTDTLPALRPASILSMNGYVAPLFMLMLKFTNTTAGAAFAVDVSVDLKLQGD